MRILLAQNSLYYPAFGGGDKSNRLLLEALAARGHECRVVARGSTSLEATRPEQYLDQLRARSLDGATIRDGVVRFRLRDVEVHAVTSRRNFQGYLSEQIRQYQPAVTILSTDDRAQLLLEAALQHPRTRIVYLVRTTLALPFGPEAAFPSRKNTRLLQAADGVAGVSRYVADYIRQWSGIPAEAPPISLLEPGPYPYLGQFDNEFVTFVNPCAVKGLSIFLALARELSDVRFAAVPTWGTTAEDRASLERLPNVTLLDPVDHIDDLLKRSRVMLMPSLWAEARGRIPVEAMLRGVPVLASNVGGLPESMMGVDYLLPVRRIERYEKRVDEQMVPVPQVPEQDIGPWLKALREITSDAGRYEQLSHKARRTALDYAGRLSVVPFEEFLGRVLERPPNALRGAAKLHGATGKPASKVDDLSPEKRALLALRLKRKAPGAHPGTGECFPNIQQATGARLRLFCFPYAGGGASVFRTWQARMPDGIAVVPARLPGRESRTSEPPIDRIDLMRIAVLEAIRPHLDRPFALFGHSMGAMIAFELARELRREKLPMPEGLLVAAARAPQLRRGYTPPPAPSDEEFLQELRNLDGLPREVLDNKDLLRHLLPALKADSALGRLYTYTDEPPLDLPIRAYNGIEDKRLPRQVVDAWREQTTASFALREFAGGHFFMHTAEEEFLKILAEDLNHLLQPE